MGIRYIPDGFCPLGDNAALRLFKLPALFLFLGGRHLPELLHLALLLSASFFAYSFFFSRMNFRIASYTQWLI